MRLARFVSSLVVFSAVGCTKDTPVQPPLTNQDSGADVAQAIAQASRPNLTAFESEESLSKFFDDLASAHEREVTRRGHMSTGAPSASAAAEATDAKKDAEHDDRITNTQEANVDEGGIVKAHGDFFVILRRGRLFTVRVGDDTLTAVGHADAFGPDIDPSGGWYDEMLISGNTVVVVGYSYQRGGTEVGLFDLDQAGGITYRATYHLRSNDYYSSRNYASRVVGTKLVFYAPMYINPWGKAEANERALPAVRRWHAGATDAEFQRIVTATNIYRPVTGFNAQALHTVTVCDLVQPEMPCRATAMMGPQGRVFYVSEKAVYVWMTDWSSSSRRSLVARMPLDGSGPSALLTMGSPVDQFSFAERQDELDVVVRSESNGDAMWAPEATSGDVALARVPLGMFSAAVTDVPTDRYTPLTKPHGNAWAFQNRFVGDTLLYGVGSSWGYAQPGATSVFAYGLADKRQVELPLSHGVDRLEALGKNAVVIGSDGNNLHFTAIALGATGPKPEGHYVRPSASQGETRSQGFFYKPESDNEGMLGLPIRGASKPGWSQLVEGSALIVFLKNRALDFQPIGELEANSLRSTNDRCRASCVDWYGNARPIFWRNRIFALMGYDLVEGKIDGASLQERRRISFAP